MVRNKAAAVCRSWRRQGAATTSNVLFLLSTSMLGFGLAVMCGEANKVPPRAKNLDLSQDGRYVSGTHGGSETGPGALIVCLGHQFCHSAVC